MIFIILILSVLLARCTSFSVKLSHSNHNNFVELLDNKVFRSCSDAKSKPIYVQHQPLFDSAREAIYLSNNYNKPLANGVKDMLIGKSVDRKPLLTKENIAKLGLNVLLAYGFVSNVSYVTCVILTWIAHGKTFGVSPLAPGQWKAFLLIYSGFFAANNVLRPFRFSLSLALSPFFEKMVVGLVHRFSLKKSSAAALLVFLVNVVGTLWYLFFGLVIATRVARVPLW